MMRIVFPAHTSSICRLGASIIKSLDTAHSILMALSSSLHTAGCTLIDSQGSHLPLSLARLSHVLLLARGSQLDELLENSAGYTRWFPSHTDWSKILSSLNVVFSVSLSLDLSLHSPRHIHPLSLIRYLFFPNAFTRISSLGLFSSQANNSWNSLSWGYNLAMLFSFHFRHSLRNTT